MQEEFVGGGTAASGDGCYADFSDFRYDDWTLNRKHLSGVLSNSPDARTGLYWSPHGDVRNPKSATSFSLFSMCAQIKIVRESMNTDRDYTFGLVFKLKYVFKIGQPWLEVFLDNEITRSQDWAIYGAHHDRPDLFRHLEFEGLREIGHFELGQSFLVEFTQMSLEEIDYRRSGKTLEPAYHFRVDALNTEHC